MSKQLIGLSIKAQGRVIFMDTTIPTDDEAFSNCMEQFDMSEDETKELLKKFRRFSDEVEYIVGLRE